MAKFLQYLYSSAAYANPIVAVNAPAVRQAVESVAEGMSNDDLLARAPDMLAMLDYWDKTDALIEGADAVKDAGQLFLPMFRDEDATDYAERLKFTKFTNIYRDIVESLAAKPFEQEITFGESDKTSTVPQEMLDFAEDVDGAGNNLTSFASATFFNGINSAIDWILVDYPTVDENVIRTRDDQKKAGIRPFWTHVLGRNVLEARMRIINGKRVLSYIRVHEPAVAPEPERVRIMERDDAGRVTWQLYSRKNKNDTFTQEATGTLSISQIPYFPFATGRQDGNSFKYFPPMRDAADLQIKLYQAESGLEWATTLTAYPMLAGNGIKPERDPNGNPKKLGVGPNRVLYAIPSGEGTFGNWAYVEPSAASLKFQSEKIDATKKDLRELGRQPLTAQSGNLTVITTAVAAGKAKSAVSAWALMLKDALENALVATAEFMNQKDYDPELNVYTDFDDLADGSADLDALLTMREKGDLTQKTLWTEMKRRKVLSQDFKDDEETAGLLAEIPTTDDPDLNDDDPAQQPGNAA